MCLEPRQAAHCHMARHWRAEPHMALSLGPLLTFSHLTQCQPCSFLCSWWLLVKGIP